VEGGGKSTELTAYVQTLEVMPETRGLGVGAELLRRMEGSALGAGAQAIRLHVDAENASAIRLYERGGYQMHDSEEDYYGRGRPGLVYARQLTIQGNR
jgi:ribosomal-protein-alanine N-acetyltransferase